MKSKEAVYKSVVSGLRELGYNLAAEVLEVEQIVLYGNPDAETPVGILNVRYDKKGGVR
jgi:hypothetical protein